MPGGWDAGDAAALLYKYRFIPSEDGVGSERHGAASSRGTRVLLGSSSHPRQGREGRQKFGSRGGSPAAVVLGAMPRATWVPAGGGCREGAAKTCGASVALKRPAEVCR